MAMFTTDPAVFIGVYQAIADYMDSVDSGDLDRLVHILREAQRIRPDGQPAGPDPDAIREGYAKAHPFPGPDGKRPTKHNLTNLRVREGSAPNRYAVDAYYIIVDGSTGEARILRTGRYKAELERRDDDWVIVALQVIHDF